MGGSHSREGELHSSDEDSESESEEEYYDEAEENQDKHCDQSPEKMNEGEMKSINGLELKLGALKINEGLQGLKPAKGFTVKLYRHIGGNTPTAKWAVADKLVSCQITRQGDDDDQDPGSEDDDEDFLKRNKGKGKDFKSWELKVGDKVRSRVDEHLQLRTFDDQLRVDFVSRGVWALKFLNPEDFKKFVGIFQDCLFENTYLMEANKENKLKVYGKDFMGWADPDAADESVWENASEGENSGNKESNHQQGNFKEEFEEEGAGGGGIQSLAMGALDYSFLVSGSGVEAVKNMRHGIHGKGLSVPFENSKLQSSTPKKALLMRAETNMLLMSPAKAGRPHSTGLHQFDVETGKVVSEWKFEKDGAPVTMRDVTNDTKGSQLDPTESTFLGLDDNRLCRWDMRVKYGNVQQIDESPVLGWTEGHQFSRGTNFQCFASTGDGSIVVGSADGRIRLYGKTSMRMAKTAFPGLGSPITHVDVTFDGKWILGTTDTYLVLVSTLFTDKDGRVKTGFSGRMGNKIAAPRLLKLTPLDSHLAGNQNKFQGGKFSWVTESGRQEHHLVASVGNYTVIWNFKQVKNSAHDCYKNQEGLKSCYCYKIVPKNESIVDSRFMHENYAVTDNPEAPLVVVTPKNVSSFSIGQDR